MREETKQKPLSEGALLAKNFVEGILKAKKLFNMYPPNNSIYINASETVFEKLTGFFQHESELSLQISQHHIYYLGEEVYHNPDKDDNLALFLFKDGLREITFLQGIMQDELDNFLLIITIDFDKDAPDDDIVTMLWEKDLEHVKYVADDILLTDEEMSEEKKAYEKIKGNAYTDHSVKKAYHESLDAKTEDVFIPSPLNEKDFQEISKKIASQGESKDERFVNILFELLYAADKPETFRNVTVHIRNTLGYCVKKGDFKNISHILSEIRKAINDETLGKNEKRSLVSVYSYINNSTFIKNIGEALDGLDTAEESEYLKCITHFDRTAIRFFVEIMGEVKGQKGRPLVIKTLSAIGRHDIKALAQGLQNSRWNIIRDTILILGDIGTSGAFEYLKNIMSHPDEKIRREAVRTIGNIKFPETSQCLLKALDDSDPTVRMTAVRALGNIRNGEVKSMLLSVMSRKDFSSREFSEKKEFFSVIANWPDNDIKSFLDITLKNRKIWGSSRHNETRACAAHALGILKDGDSIPLLMKTVKAGNRILRETSMAALNKIRK